jgi:hypothetical protein
MKTLPPISFNEHIENLLKWLRRRIPEIDTMRLRYFDSHDLMRQQGHWVLPAAALGDLTALRIMFNRLCHEGRDWINLAGAGMTTNGEYLISLEYSDTVGREETFINISGPPLNADGSIMHSSYITII